MSLHEQYETLLRRGMTEHPRLYWRYDGHDGIWMLRGDSGEHLEVATFGMEAQNDARDLVTMHALRWFTGEEWTNYSGALTQLASYIPGTMRRGVLDAILEATEHLEPKTT